MSYITIILYGKSYNDVIHKDVYDIDHNANIDVVSWENMLFSLEGCGMLEGGMELCEYFQIPPWCTITSQEYPYELKSR